jgi:hypothetical protein
VKDRCPIEWGLDPGTTSGHPIHLASGHRIQGEAKLTQLSARKVGCLGKQKP